ncbi:hypothetical protein CEP88_08830 [Roseobacter denitrificans]|uniref:PEP-CTERM exosortase interaction domain protein n=1 Tax=Roseobacter denitrificans (strain ATCC 33942 / OCh 114) TaxID=375451 RepID=Q161I0_ROSDO|nr:hypothetical protein [Roseobacter denitrificans]ABG33363.1 hypothetical protein RD1_3905 [Roseobacter denitrificans OCh 114]AVL52687.1 hypothetical protein CEP88_08830 [Roseobacter denitrificans]SFG23417.1 hypothetical protein SAMN05443635_11091 [Roseobacter denitrificans OCh 114]
MKLTSIALALFAFSTTLCSATTYTFDVTARVDGAFLRNPAENAQVVKGGDLNVRMTYSFPPSRQFGGDYLYNPGLETLTLTTPQGYRLVLDNRLVSIASIGTTDFFTVQSFLSEDPNGWNFAMDINATGWRNGDTSLPTMFPSTFDSAFLTAYFLDEQDQIQGIDATILSVTPATVPLPASGLLFASAGLMIVWRQRKTARLQRRNASLICA